MRIKRKILLFIIEYHFLLFKKRPMQEFEEITDKLIGLVPYNVTMDNSFRIGNACSIPEGNGK